MKKINYSLTFIAILALLFTSCSKEETDVSVLDSQDTFQLQFNASLNDFNRQQQQTKDHLSDDPIECNEEAPAYVLVALTDSNMDWVADKNPEADGAGVDDFIRVNLKDNNGSWETEFSDDLGLPAGTYQLQYFIVYTAADEVLWVAPRDGGAYASSVGDPLPKEITLGAGTKPYISVDVLCYIPRVEEAFGYVFFDINPIPITNNYCIFVNFCDDGTGREYPANFQLEIWGDAFDGSDVVIGGETNSVSGEGNLFAATVLCVPLPPLGEGEVYYVRVTVLDAGAYDADASDFFDFTISQADVDAQLEQTPKYEHIRINCDGDGNGECDPANPNADCDDDGILNECDTDNPNYSTFDCDNDGVSNGEDKCEGSDDSIDFDLDTIPDGCDPDDDNDGIMDVDENSGCRLNPDLNCGVDPNPTCTISARSGCTMGSTDGTLSGVLEGGFIDIADSGDNLIAQGTIIIVDGKVNVSVSPVLGNYISDYEIELQPIGVTNSDTKCAEGLSEPASSDSGIQTVPFDFDPAATYSIRIEVNTCSRSI